MNIFLLSCFAIFIALEAKAMETIVHRDPDTGFPQCIENAHTGEGLIFHYRSNHLARKILVQKSLKGCYEDNIPSDGAVSQKSWEVYQESQYPFLSQELRHELSIIKQGTIEYRHEKSAEEYIESNRISKYTTELNRDLTKKYGPIFSAQVFKSLIEKKSINRKLQELVTKNLQNRDLNTSSPFSAYNDRLRIVVSFGLGWEEKYGIGIPFYLRDFLEDMKSLGLPVNFMKKNPFGRVEDNYKAMVPQLEQEFKSGKDLIYVSLCKGTPELLRAEAELVKNGIRPKGKILGHVNLSGMLSGAIFSDFSKEIILPKVVAPIMKLIPLDLVKDNGRMVDAIEFMKTSIIEKTVGEAIPYLDRNRFYLNVTGAPMSDQLLYGNSPMKPVVKYGLQNTFINSANDGFLELPGTLIPETVSTNQATLVMDASHLLSDGEISGFKISDQRNRRVLYNSIIEAILEKNGMQ